jgi:hypothetical protein
MAVSPDHQKRRAFLRLNCFSISASGSLCPFFFFGFSEIPWRYCTRLPLKTARSKPAYSPKLKKSFFLDATFSAGGPPSVTAFFPQLESATTSKAAGRLSLRALGASSLKMWHGITALGDRLYAYEVYHMPRLSQTVIFAATRSTCGHIGASSD